MASAQGPPILSSLDRLRACRPEPHDHLALDVLPRVVVVAGDRQAEAVPEKLDVARRKRPLRADVARQRDRLSVLERTALPIDFDRNRGLGGALDAKDGDTLVVRAIVAARFHAPLAQVLRQVGGREAEALGKRRASLELVGCQVREPAFEIGGGDRRQATFAVLGLRAGGYTSHNRQNDHSRTGTSYPHHHLHPPGESKDSPSRYLFALLARPPSFACPLSFACCGRAGL